MSTAACCNPFTEEYYMDGIRSGLSNYENYVFRPELTIPACNKMADHLGARRGDSLLDVGAARGFYVKAFTMLGLRAHGYDISEWAVENCHPDVKHVMSTTFPLRTFDWATAKDVAEHMSEEQLSELASGLEGIVSRGMLFIVPLTGEVGGKYLRREDEADSTHILRWPLDVWIAYFEEAFSDFDVSGSYDIKGIKPASSDVRHSCGFLTMRRR